MEKITREQFMAFFRSDDFHSKVTTDDCIEIFSTVLKGSSDISPELFNEVARDYGANHLITIDSDWLETYFEIVSGIVLALENKNAHNVATKRAEQQGTGGLYELAEELTHKFQKEYKDKEWDGEFFETIENFLQKELG